MPPLLLPDPIVSELEEPCPWFADDPAPDGLLPAVPIFELEDPMLEPDVPMLEPEADGDDVEDGEVVLPDVPLLIPLPAVPPEVEPEPMVPEPDDWAKAAPPKPSAITAAVVRRRRFIDDFSSLTFVLAAGLPACKSLRRYPPVEIANRMAFFFVPDERETDERREINKLRRSNI